MKKLITILALLCLLPLCPGQAVPDVNITHIDGNPDNLALPLFSYAIDGNVSIDFNFATGTNNDFHLADINYSSSNAQGTGTGIYAGLNVDGNTCITNFIGNFDENHAITGQHADPNLVGYWKFDGQEDDYNSLQAFDYSGQENNGHYLNGADNNGLGKWDTNSGFFDGTNDYINMGDTLLFEAASPATIMVWFNINSFDTQNYLITRQSTNFTRTDYGLAVYDNTTLRYYYDDAGALDLDDWTVPQIETNTWHQLVALLNTDATVELYFDGNGLGSNVASHDDYASAEFNIGRGYETADTGPFFFMDGLIEEVKIYGKILTAAEIFQDYNLGIRNHRKCSWDWNIYEIPDNNYYALVDIRDSSGNSDFNASDNSFSVNSGANLSPTVDLLKIEGVDLFAAIPFFSYEADVNLTVDFGIFDSDNDRITLDINYSLTAIEGSGTIIYQDLNLTSDYCVVQDWNDTTSACSLDWNIADMGDNNFYLLASVSDGTVVDFNTHAQTIGIDNNAPVYISISPFVDYFIYQDAANFWLYASDSYSGLNNCNYTSYFNDVPGVNKTVDSNASGFCPVAEMLGDAGSNAFVRYYSISDNAGNTVFVIHDTGTLTRAFSYPVDPENILDRDIGQAITFFGFAALQAIGMAAGLIIIFLVIKKLLFG